VPLKPAICCLIYNNVAARSESTIWREGRSRRIEARNETRNVSLERPSNRREFARARNSPLSLRAGLEINATTRLPAPPPSQIASVSSLSFLAASLPPSPPPRSPPPLLLPRWFTVVCTVQLRRWIGNFSRRDRFVIVRFHGQSMKTSMRRSVEALLEALSFLRVSIKCQGDVDPTEF